LDHFNLAHKGFKALHQQQATWDGLPGGHKNRGQATTQLTGSIIHEHSHLLGQHQSLGWVVLRHLRSHSTTLQMHI